MIIYKSMKVDFIESNLNGFTKILRPQLHNKNDHRNDKRAGFSSIKIEKSFEPQRKSTMSQAFRPEIEKLKQMYKKKLQEEKRAKALLAEGKITREEMQDGQKAKKEQAVVQEEKVTIDQSGQVRDEQGNLLFMKNRTTELLINKKKDEEAQMKSMAKKQRIKFHQRLGKSFLDRNLIVSSSKKRVRRSILGLQFLEKGSYQPVQHRKQVKEEIEQLNDIFTDKDQIQSKIMKRRNKIGLTFNRDVPNLQWWDAALLNNIPYLQLLQSTQSTTQEELQRAVSQLQMDKLINYEEIGQQTFYQKVGVSNEDERIILPMYLTKQQRKKLKRKRKHQKLLQKNDKIKLGLIEPEKPKLRVGNMAIVMKNQFIVDPSKIEAQAKKQTEERINKHLSQNSVRKLTKAQKKDKVIRKLKRDSAKECRRAVFRVAKLIDTTHIFKVNMNAKQLALNGFVIKPTGELARFPTMVLVEGGLRAVKFYRNLMLNRIRWGDKDPANSCKLIWQGEIQGSSAGKWRMNEVGDEVEAIRILTEKKLQNFWEYLSAD